MAIHMGYMGWAKIGSTLMKITGGSLNPVQAIEAPELVQGDFNKKGVNYGKIEIGGNVTGPIGELSFPSLWTDATARTTDGDKMNSAALEIIVMYYRTGGRKFTGCSVNSLQISVTAGDVATFTADFFGTGVSAYSSPESTILCEKLVTWDKCSCTGAFPSTQVQSFTFTMGNALQRIYKLNTGDLFPAEVLAGMRDITGTVSIYAEGAIDTVMPLWPAGEFGADRWDDYTATSTAVNFDIAGLVTTNANVMYSRPEATPQTGPTIYTVNFIGVCDQGF